MTAQGILDWHVSSIAISHRLSDDIPIFRYIVLLKSRSGAERETDKLKKVEYMEEHLGEIYEGVISSITSWGVYVELPNTIEGMIHVSMLPGDYFYYDEESYEMVGQATNLRYKLGQKLKVRVNATDKISRTIDFVIPQEWELEPDDDKEEV